MNKGNLEAKLRDELAAWHEPIEADEPSCDVDYIDPEYYDMCVTERERDLYGHWQDDDEWDWYDFSMSNITRLSDSYWDEYWHCIGNDMFTNDSSGNPGHYQQLWMAAGYIPRYIPFPHTVRTWFNGKLVVCYKP